VPSECLAGSRRRTLRADILAGRIDPRREGVGVRAARPASLLRVGMRRNGVGDRVVRPAQGRRDWRGGPQIDGQP
ncbi:unnamed protein product, partial [Ectocarpus sp. 13 AM-2016]